MKRRQFTAALGVLPLAGTAFAQGDDWPQRTVRIVCPFTPGGSQDNIARRLGAKLTDYLGQSFVIENRTGAGGSIAADNVAKAAPDGYSVLLGNIGSHALVPHLYAKPTYNAATDLETVVWIGTQPNLLCCHPSFPHDTIPKLIAAAKKEPGKYSYGSSGLGTSPSLTMELFKQKTGTDLTFISYRGAAAAAADVLAGHVPICIANIDSLMGQVSCRQTQAHRHDRRQALVGRCPTRRPSPRRAIPTSWSPPGRCGRCRPARRPRPRRSSRPRRNARCRTPTCSRACALAASSPAACRSPRSTPSSRRRTSAGAR